MRSLRMFFVAAPLISAVVLTTSPSANSGEKRCQTLLNCNAPAQATCTAPNSQPVESIQTCCQPVAASVQPQIELVAYTRPALPRRLTPQPDSLDIRQAMSDMACAQFLAGQYGGTEVYYGLRCSDNYPVAIYANNLAPLPGACESPNGACVSLGSNVVPTAFGNVASRHLGSVIQNGVRLTHKRDAGREPINSPNSQANGAHQLKERLRISEPLYARFMLKTGSEPVVVEIQKYFVRGTGKSSQELAGTLTIGTEIKAVPTGKRVIEIGREDVHVVDDHIARLTIRDARYDIVTATRLVP